jgi:hypothetical protein
MCCVVCSYGEYHSPKCSQIAAMLCLCYVAFFIFLIECVLSHSCSSYSEAFYINGLNVNVYATSFNDVTRC